MKFSIQESALPGLLNDIRDSATLGRSKGLGSSLHPSSVWLGLCSTLSKGRKELIRFLREENYLPGLEGIVPGVSPEGRG